MRTSVLVLTIVVLVGCVVAGSAIAASSSDTIREAEADQQQRVDEVITFLHGKVEQQFADLRAASRSEAVKALYRPFVAKTMRMLRADIGAIGFGRRSATGFDQRPLPISYTALSRQGAFRNPNLWLAVATHRNNDRPDYEPIQNDGDVVYYRNLWRAFVLLAPFWAEDGTLAP